MTIEELRELNPTIDKPIRLSADNQQRSGYDDNIRIIKVFSRTVIWLDWKGDERSLSFDANSFLAKFPSQKPEPKFETLYECLGENSFGGFFTNDGYRPNFDKRILRSFREMNPLRTKTGRTLKLNMDTWEIVQD